MHLYVLFLSGKRQEIGCEQSTTIEGLIKMLIQKDQALSEKQFVLLFERQNRIITKEDYKKTVQQMGITKEDYFKILLEDQVPKQNDNQLNSTTEQATPPQQPQLPQQSPPQTQQNQNPNLMINPQPFVGSGQPTISTYYQQNFQPAVNKNIPQNSVYENQFNAKKQSYQIPTQPLEQKQQNQNPNFMINPSPFVGCVQPTNSTYQQQNFQPAVNIPQNSVYENQFNSQQQSYQIPAQQQESSPYLSEIQELKQKNLVLEENIRSQEGKIIDQEDQIKRLTRELEQANQKIKEQKAFIMQRFPDD